MNNHDYTTNEQHRRVLDAHREAVANEDQPLLNDNTEGALFDAAAQLIRCLESQLEGWAEKAGKA